MKISRQFSCRPQLAAPWLEGPGIRRPDATVTLVSCYVSISEFLLTVTSDFSCIRTIFYKINIKKIHSSFITTAAPIFVLYSVWSMLDSKCNLLGYRRHHSICYTCLFTTLLVVITISLLQWVLTLWCLGAVLWSLLCSLFCLSWMLTAK
jgi:hypothetical protein